MRKFKHLQPIIFSAVICCFFLALSSPSFSQFRGTGGDQVRSSVSLPAWGVIGGVEHWTLRYASLGIARKHKSIISSRTEQHIHYSDISFRQSTTDLEFQGVELTHAFVDMIGGGGRVGYYWNGENTSLSLQPFAAFNYQNLVASFGYNFYISEIRIPDLLDFSLRIQYFLPIHKPVTREELMNIE